MRVRALVPIVAAVSAAAWVSYAQIVKPKPDPLVPKFGKMHLWATIGSFRLEGTGRVEIAFTGSLMVTNYVGAAPVVTGKVRKEFEGMGRIAWFGTGKAVIDGKFRSFHWFGKNMDCRWVGTGQAMVFGEFDQKQDTGWVQVDDQPAYPWMTTGRAFWTPKEIDPAWQANQKAKTVPTTPSKNGLPGTMKVG